MCRVWRLQPAPSLVSRQSDTHSYLTLMGQLLGGPNSLAEYTGPTSRHVCLIGRLIVISRNLSDDKVSNRSKLIEDPYRAPFYDKDD